MVIQKIFPRRVAALSDEEMGDYMEVSVSGAGLATAHLPEPTRVSGGGRVGIRIEKLDDFSDTDRILKTLREGSIVFLRIKGLKDKDIGELKRSVERLKKTVMAQNGEIVGVEQDWLLLTPDFATVHK